MVDGMAAVHLLDTHPIAAVVNMDIPIQHVVVVLLIYAR
jgi:hypothetical protein